MGTTSEVVVNVVLLLLMTKVGWHDESEEFNENLPVG
jgi:hypothetical protein